MRPAVWAIAPEKCAYIGDRIDRDVAAARKAGFSKAVILRDPRQVKLEKDDRFAPRTGSCHYQSD